MNRPTIDIEELLLLADEALSAGDSQEAIDILRKATSVAPLRKDIRNRLALALEGTPVNARRTLSAPTVEVDTLNDDYSDGFQDPVFDGNEYSGRESIRQIARRAFEAATEQTSHKASAATRKLTNLLHQGLSSWKTDHSVKRSMSEPVSEHDDASEMFSPESDLNDYLNRQEKVSDLVSEPIEEAESQDDQVLTITRPSPVSRKASRTSADNARKRKPADVEDVLAAGIGGLIEVAGHVNKVKICYGIAYFFMVVLFGFACFDVSRKFSDMRQTEGGQQVVAASLSMGKISQPVATDNSLQKARSLVAQGQADEAVELYKTLLENGSILSQRETVRTELVSLLNKRAEKHLRVSEFDKSVTAYREALQYLPNDPDLSIRLSNALYYQGTMGTQSSVDKTKILTQAESTLEAVVKKYPDNLQAARLLAMIYSESNNKSKANAAWKKVKTMAPAGSSALSEAESHLK